MIKHLGEEVPPHPDVWRQIGHCESTRKISTKLPIEEADDNSRRSPRLSYPPLPQNCGEHASETSERERKAGHSVECMTRGLLGCQYREGKHHDAEVYVRAGRHSKESESTEDVFRLSEMKRE